MDQHETVLTLYFRAFQGSLLHGVIHNLSTPLQSLMFLLSFLSREVSPTGQVEGTSECGSQELSRKIVMMEEEVSKMCRICEEFRLLDQMVVHETPMVNIPECFGVFSKVLNANLFVKHFVRLSIRGDEGINVISIPARVFTLIFTELVQNAISALKRVEHGRKMMVFRARRDEIRGEVRIEVGDNGCGWHPSQDATSFFAPSVSRWPHLGEGCEDECAHVGMGLFCVRGMLRQYHGEIELFRQGDFTWASCAMGMDALL